ncbi:FliI/YscN family ATPase [Planctomycetes bacterium K23_9]|uniref:Putative ATP synthase YscN n=1 Tax=Stieleria marina TaxID=1930275 RepID=A0A517NN38_9BACT|nr:putative ATP synthase YscN [Planctomycetes bacterium K23_9]
MPDFLQPPRLDPSVAAERINQASLLQVYGQVAALVGDCVEVQGMSAPVGSVCEITSADQNSLARVIGFNRDRIVLSPLQHLGSVSAGQTVRLVDSSCKIRVGPELCGRVLDAFGNPLDGRPLPQGLRSVDTHQTPPHSLARPPIDSAIQTGVRTIDAFLTCGRGQRLGIFAGSGVGKSTLLGMLARGTKADRIVIGLVGERGREVQEFLERSLGAEGRERSVVVVATSDAPAAQRVTAASTATAIAESFRDQGEDVLLLIDSVTRLATAQRELGLAAGEPPTTRGYPPSVFNQLPRLVERAGRTKSGSITAFYTVLVEGDDPNEPVADALRGLLDGHIMLDRSLAAQSHWPPINVLDSISRLQPHLVTKENLASAARSREFLSDYQQHRDLISIGAYRSGTDARVDRAIEKQESLRSFMQQDTDEIAAMDQTFCDLAQLANS